MGTVFPIRLPGSRLLGDLVTTYTGFLANAILGFVTLKLVAKHLGPGDFGIATLANIFMAIIAGLSEPGIGTALVRLASNPVMTRAEVEKLVVAAIQLKLVIVTAVCGLTYLLMPWITTAFMHRPEMTTLFRCCLLGGAFLSLATFAGALFQIGSAYRENAAAIAVAGAVRTAAVVGLWQSGHLNLWTAVASMILMNVVQCGMCVISLRQMLSMLPWRCRSGPQILQLVRYGQHLVIWLLAGTIHPRADMLLLAHYVGDNRLVGFYSAGAQLCTVVPMLTGAINLVLMPRISALRTPAEMRRSLRNSGLGALALFGLLAPLALAARPIVQLVFGSHYGPAVFPFQVLLCAAAVDLALNPLSNFWHALNRPAMLSALNIARLSLLVGAAVVTIPRWGGVGAAAAVLLSTAVPLAGQGLLLGNIIRGQAAAAGARPERGRPPADPAPASH
jgi:O-antigen/teichoic acid export membrane protein